MTFNLKEFKLLDLFEVSRGSGTSADNAKENPGSVPHISASVFNNGSDCRTSEKANHNGKCITTSANGTDIGISFYQPEDFCATQDVAILRPKDKMSTTSLLFIAAVISNEKYRFNYGRKFNGKRMDLGLWLPATEDDKLELDHITMAEAVNQAEEAKYKKIQLTAKAIKEL